MSEFTRRTYLGHKTCGCAVSEFQDFRIAKQFLQHVRKTDSCWMWDGPRDRAGYGRCGVGMGVRRRAHVVAWELVKGPVPQGLILCHHCDTPACVNPAHLFVGTDLDNTLDRIAKNRTKAGRVSLPSTILDIRNLYQSGRFSQKQIGAKYGVSPSAISYIVTGKGGSPKRGLTATQVSCVSMLSSIGILQRVIANWFGVSQTSISWRLMRHGTPRRQRS